MDEDIAGVIERRPVNYLGAWHRGPWPVLPVEALVAGGSMSPIVAGVFDVDWFGRTAMADRVESEDIADAFVWFATERQISGSYEKSLPRIPK